MTLDKNIILCGFMGCGKSTVGRLLAQNLGTDFTDMDEFIEASAQESIPDMFNLYGEPYFREREHEAALALAKKSGTIVAAGGGALLYERNAAALKQSGVVVFLDCDFETCYRRISKSDRPIVRGNTKDGLETLYHERRQVYLAVSDFTLSSDESAGVLVEKIITMCCSPQ